MARILINPDDVEAVAKEFQAKRDKANKSSTASLNVSIAWKVNGMV